MNRLSTFFALAMVAPIAVAQVVIKPAGELKWAEGAAPAVSTASVDGDMTKGPGRFFLRYASGFVAPPHHHTADHTTTTVTGTLVMIVDGKEHRLPPGSYMTLKNKAPHAARCEAGPDCIMFIDTLGPWDAVMKK